MKDIIYVTAKLDTLYRILQFTNQNNKKTIKTQKKYMEKYKI